MPVVIAAGVIGFVLLCQLLPSVLSVSRRTGESGFDLFDRVEWITYDWRMRQSSAGRSPCATNLGAVFIDDLGLSQINRDLGYSWPWPRHLFGRVVRELAAQGARAIACDVFFLERHMDYTETRVRLDDGRILSSDQFFALQLKSAGNVLLGCPGEIATNQWRLLSPPDLFLTNAAGVGYAGTDRDADGVLRRARPYRDDPVHGRIWHLGLRLAAESLGLDLTRAVVERHCIRLTGTGGLRRVIPIDRQGLFYIDWSLSWFDPHLTNATFEEVLAFDALRQAGETNLEPAFAGRLVVLGSIGSGSNVSDVGATPVAKETYLMSKHWNVANSLLQGRFIHPPTWWEATLLIVLMGTLSGVLTWRLRALPAMAAVLAVTAVYTGLAFWTFAQWRYWLPLALPVGGALFLTHVCLVTWRVVFEQNERRRVRAIFSRIVAPEVVNELLGQERLSLGGTLCEVTVLFADVRGFTRLTDESHKQAEAYLREHQLSGAEASAFLEQNARETLETVNLYLATIADNVKKHKGTLDKYIGDCVMAFWGAPIPNPAHAVAAVRAAVDSQQAMAALNRQRAEINERIRRENAAQAASGRPLRRPLGLLSLGTGINTGTVTVGLMGSEAHIVSYTVFGREVNLASRLESVSGHGRIIISESTFRDLGRQAPDLAASCRALPAVTVKGIEQPISIYEVPWDGKRDGDVPRGSEAPPR